MTKKTSKTVSKTMKVTLVKSLNGRVKAHQACVQTLGLKKIGQTVELSDEPCARGKINKVGYLLKVEE